MKIFIFGAGATGGYMGVKLAHVGADKSLVVRGPHLAAMQDKGLTLIEDGQEATHLPGGAAGRYAGTQRRSRGCAVDRLWPGQGTGQRGLSGGGRQRAGHDPPYRG